MDAWKGSKAKRTFTHPEKFEGKKTILIFMILSQCKCVYIYINICSQCVFPNEPGEGGRGMRPGKMKIHLILKLRLCKVTRCQGLFTEVSFTDFLNVCVLNFKIMCLVSIHSSA